MSRSLSRHLIGATLVLAATAAFAAPVPVLKFEGAIGVDPLTAAGGVDALNVVRGIDPGGRAWVIRKFDATVYSDGSIAARGKGLLFSSGDVIATRGPVTHVAATLACGPANNTATRYTTAPAPLDAAGNFTISGPLLDGVNQAVLPVPCDNPQLLIRAANPTTGAAGGWFAAGILERDDD
ncbi:hypothetical protein [uncultured Piscinibacter sp.]|uniref:hypothetical protein n=1 Tax=uncultured Piscinibacter sp. TaxID=1131835 RepID=UPI00262962A8|nr:hypothetical protein [uncultured Piscinibacter sp.]